MLLIQVKIMPASPQSDLKMVKESAERIISKHGQKLLKDEMQPIAFGINALLLIFTWPDDESPDKLEQELSELEDTNSAEIVDVRRAIG